MNRISSMLAGAIIAAAVIAPQQRAAAGSGADAYIPELWEFKQFGRVGSIVGCMGDTTVCNIGTAELDWDGPPAELHPFTVFNMYRLSGGGGRLQQIGQSWAKHALGASSNPGCDMRCEPAADNDALGVGCLDTYSANFNGNMQPFMGPRSEINPWSGAFAYPGSHISTSHSHNAIAHRCQLKDSDLQASQNPGAQYFYEMYMVAHDDDDHLNSIVHDLTLVSGSPGGTWQFNCWETSSVIGPAIISWPGATVTTIPQNPVNDGQAMLAVKVTGPVGGFWHYEYAIYNHDMDRGIGSFALPIPFGTSIVNAGFYAVDSHDEPYSNDDWTFELSASMVWTAESHAKNPFANVLRWGTMYNFWFDSNAGPGNVIATLGAFEPGSPASYSAAVQGPAIGVPIDADINNDGSVDVDDLLAVINAWGPCPSPPAPCPADINSDEAVDVDDLLLVIGKWG